MRILERAVDTVEGLMEAISRQMIGRDLASYCDLVTAVGLSDEERAAYPDLVDPHILVTRQQAMLTVFDVQGTFRILSEHEFGEVIANLRLKLGSYMRSYGHSLSLCLERDPDRGYDELMRLAEGQINTARRAGIMAEDIVMSRVERNAPLVAFEQNLLMIYTHMSAMAPEERKRVLVEQTANAAKHKIPPMKFGQNPAVALAQLKYRHDAFVERVKEDFLKSGVAGESGILIRRLSAHEAARAVRIQVDRENTSQKWRPVLPGDRVRAHGAPSDKDYSDVTYPRLNYQIATHDVETSGDFVKTDQLYHTAISMELGPQEPQPFQVFMEKLQRSIPWRIRFDLEPGGLDKARGRRTLLSFVGMFPSNRAIRDSFQELERTDKNDPVCTFRVVASTWGSSEAQAKERRAALERAMQAWGVCQVRTSHGDPQLALASSVAAYSTTNVGNMLFPPLGDALKLLPFQRPATPWAKNGNFVQRTPDGKIYPIGLASGLQDVDIRVVVATPGSGKSMMLNCQNFAGTLAPGLRRLPLMTILDVGFSAAGFIEMLRDSLPEERQNEVVAIRLQNDVKYAVNFLDVQLGAMKPTRAEADFMVDFVSGLLMDTQHLQPVSPDAGRLATMLIKTVFPMKLEKSPEPFEFGVEALVDAAIEARGLREARAPGWWEEATWVEVRDLLFEKECRREASLAHFRAMPTLSDLSACLNDPAIRDMFKSAGTGRGELLLDYAERAFTVAADQYALFAGRTRYELGSETRIVALDLQNVVGTGGTNEAKLKTSLMYLFGRHIGARNYFLDWEELQDVLPSNGLYHAYHQARIDDIKDEQKTIIYDELHNIGYKNPAIEGASSGPGLTMVPDRMVKDGLEVRKWGVSVVGSSQYLSHFPDGLLNAASSIYVMRGGNSSDAKVLQERWNVSDECIRQLNRDANGPGPHGGTYLGVFKTTVGTITQMLTNTPGPLELWAFNTNPADVALRRRVCKEIGTYEGRKLLAARFKTGSAKALISSMRSDARDDEDGSVIARLAEKLLEEYREQRTNELYGGAA